MAVEQLDREVPRPMKKNTQKTVHLKNANEYENQLKFPFQ